MPMSSDRPDTGSTSESNHDRLGPYGWTPSTAADYEPFAGPDRHPARVVRIDRGEATVALPEGLSRCDISRPPSDPGSEPGPPATGDWVALAPGQGDMWSLAAILPRRSVIDRLDPDATGRQVLAANLDMVFVVSPLDLPAKPGMVERALVVVWESGAVPALILTKSDLVDEAVLAAGVARTSEAAPGVDVFVVSSTTGEGLEPIQAIASAGVTICLIGPSGAGKSTLANALMGSEMLATGDTRADGAGRHTTSVRELVPIPGGAVLIDTPGLRTLGLAGQTGGVALTFPDIEGFAAECRFRDCGHGTEPGCAVSAAVRSGELPERRLTNYHRFLRELAHEESRSDVRGRRASMRAEGKRFTRAIRGKDEW